MKNKLIFSVLLILFVMCNSFAQVTTQIQDVLVNNQTTVSNCGLIDVGSTNNNTSTVAFKLMKPENQAVGTILVTVYLKRNSSTDPGTNKGVYSVQSNVWTTQFEGQIPINFSASEIELTGSSIYIKSTENGTFLSDSCEYPLKKTAVPSFNLTPTSVSVSCGSTDSETFTVGNSNIPSGSTLDYVWTIGNGWKFIDGTVAPSTYPSTSSVLTLVPYVYPPGNVSVVPKLNGVSYPMRTSIVSIGGFNPTLSIDGPNETCTTANYSVTLPPGLTVSSWSNTFSNIATVSFDGNQATLTRVGNGIITLQANVRNACGQFIPITKSIIVGTPKVNDNTLYTNATSFKINTSDQFNVTAVAGQNITYQWSIVKLNSVCVANGQGQYPAGTIFPRFYAGGGYVSTLTSASRYATIDWGNCPGSYVLNVEVLNSCGASPLGYKSIQLIDPYVTDPCLDRQAKIYPNPVKNGSVVVRIPDPNGPPCGPIGGKQSAKTSVENLINDVQIYNMMGRMVYKNSFDTYEFRIDYMNLNNGSYIIVIQDNLGNLDRQLLVIDN